MKATDLQPILDGVRNVERQELASALKAHGGIYIFPIDERPCIEIYDDIKGPKSADAGTVKLFPDGKIRIYVTDEDKDSYAIESDDVYPGHLSSITRALPEPDGESGTDPEN